MAAWRYFTVEITSASISDLLTAISEKDFRLSNIRYLDELRIQADVTGDNYIKLNDFIEARGDSYKIVGSRGVYLIIRRILRRPVMLIGCLLWLFLVIYLPTRVLFVYVDGNNTIDSIKIMEAAERSGICFGAARRYVRSEKVKNKLLSEIDTLQWGGVNTYGCVAVISVKERALPQHNVQNPVFNSIVAVRDGIVTQATVTSGNLLCKVGQAVRQGQVLVSGFTDCGLSVRAEQAEAEIRAFTNRLVSAVTPAMGVRRISINETETKYCIQIGKKIIKLSNKSSIQDRECVKIYTQKYLTLPGGFELPVSLITEKIYWFDEQQIAMSDTDDFMWLKESVESYLLSDMVAGKILHSGEELNSHDGLCCLNGVYVCNEMIGQVRVEKIGEYNG